MALDKITEARRLCKRIAFFKGAHVVFVGRSGRPDFCPAGGARHQALEQRPGFSARVAGVFDASASPALIAAALSEVCA